MKPENLLPKYLKMASKIEGKNFKIVGFLVLTFNLINGTYGPCKKSTDQ